MCVLGDDADGGAQRLHRRVAYVDAIDPHRAGTDVVQAGHEVADGGLSRPGRSHQGDQLARSCDERHVEQHLLAWCLFEQGNRFKRRERDFFGARIAEVDVIELDSHRTARDRDSLGAFGDHRLQIEDLEDTIERHERSHDIDLHVRERGERCVQTIEVGGERDDGTEFQCVMNGEDATPAVDHRGGERRGEQQSDHEHPGVQRLRDPDVTDPGRALFEQARFRTRVAEEFHEQSQRNASEWLPGCFC